MIEYDESETVNNTISQDKRHEPIQNFRDVLKQKPINNFEGAALKQDGGKVNLSSRTLKIIKDILEGKVLAEGSRRIVNQPYIDMLCVAFGEVVRNKFFLETQVTVKSK